MYARTTEASRVGAVSATVLCSNQKHPDKNQADQLCTKNTGNIERNWSQITQQPLFTGKKKSWMNYQ